MTPIEFWGGVVVGLLGIMLSLTVIVRSQPFLTRTHTEMKFGDANTLNTGHELAPFLATEPFTFGSLASGTLLDICGSYGVIINANSFDRGVCTHNDVELRCGSFAVNTADGPCNSRLLQGLSAYAIPVSQHPL